MILTVAETVTAPLVKSIVAGESENSDITGPSKSLRTVGVTVIEPLKLIEVVALTAGFVSSAGMLLLTSAVQL